MLAQNRNTTTATVSSASAHTEPLLLNSPHHSTNYSSHLDHNITAKECMFKGSNIQHQTNNSNAFIHSASSLLLFSRPIQSRWSAIPSDILHEIACYLDGAELSLFSRLDRISHRISRQHDDHLWLHLLSAVEWKSDWLEKDVRMKMKLKRKMKRVGLWIGTKEEEAVELARRKKAEEVAAAASSVSSSSPASEVRVSILPSPFITSALPITPSTHPYHYYTLRYSVTLSLLTSYNSYCREQRRMFAERTQHVGFQWWNDVVSPVLMMKLLIVQSVNIILQLVSNDPDPTPTFYTLWPLLAIGALFNLTLWYFWYIRYLYDHEEDTNEKSKDWYTSICSRPSILHSHSLLYSSGSAKFYPSSWSLMMKVMHASVWDERGNGGDVSGVNEEDEEEEEMGQGLQLFLHSNTIIASGLAYISIVHIALRSVVDLPWTVAFIPVYFAIIMYGFGPILVKGWWKRKMMLLHHQQGGVVQEEEEQQQHSSSSSSISYLNFHLLALFTFLILLNIYFSTHSDTQTQDPQFYYFFLPLYAVDVCIGMMVSKEVLSMVFGGGNSGGSNSISILDLFLLSLIFGPLTLTCILLQIHTSSSTIFWAVQSYWWNCVPLLLLLAFALLCAYAIAGSHVLAIWGQSKRTQRIKEKLKEQLDPKRVNELKMPSAVLNYEEKRMKSQHVSDMVFDCELPPPPRRHADERINHMNIDSIERNLEMAEEAIRASHTG